jgi:hypothetical protein
VGVVNDYLGCLAERAYSPRTVRAYVFDLRHHHSTAARRHAGHRVFDHEGVSLLAVALRCHRRTGPRR